MFVFWIYFLILNKWKYKQERHHTKRNILFYALCSNEAGFYGCVLLELTENINSFECKNK